MDCSSNIQDCEDVSDVSSFCYSGLFESTPKTETSRFINKKRKVLKGANKSRTKVSEFDSTSTSYSGECLSKDLKNIRIEHEYLVSLEDYNEPSPKYLKSNGCERIITPPSTPKSLNAYESTPKKSGTLQKCSSACSVPSPLIEQHEILYPNLRPLAPQRKPLSPQKLKQKIGFDECNATPVRKIDKAKECKPLNKVLRANVVMDVVFKYLSKGDLYRISMVSRDFRNALFQNLKAFNRYEEYKESHKKNKENYKITPPNSPENQSSFLNGSVSPKTQKYLSFKELGDQLNCNQSLIKCPTCENPSVVEASIGQCQNKYCGFIYCQKCHSSAYNANDFYDTCRGITLDHSLVKKRKGLDDLSNRSPDFNVSSILSSTFENWPTNLHYSSGYASGYDSSRTPASVKRNLSRSFHNNENLSGPQKVLFDSNSTFNNSVSSLKNKKLEGEKKLFANVLPVVRNKKKKIEVQEPSSPPSKTYSIGSKQSKKMLKRLTR